MRGFWIFAVLLALLIALGCGGSGFGSGLFFNLTPTETAVVPGGTTQFDVITNAPPSVDWSAPDGGTVVDGLFTAPSIPGDYRVIAEAAFVAGLSRTATVHVRNVGITLVPATLDVLPGATVSNAFTAKIAGSANPAVTWSVEQAGGGTIVNGTPDASGNARADYTAPATPGTYTVRATSVADPTSTATASVRVLGSNAIVISPQVASITTNQTQALDVTLTDGTGAIDSTTPLIWELKNNAIGATLTGSGLRQRTLVPPAGFSGTSTVQVWVRKSGISTVAVANVTITGP